MTSEDSETKIHAILRWSALPGASRHHWGTDLDVFDANTLGPEETVQLTPAEVERGGPFFKLHQWLDANLSAFGFFRPYDQDRGGVAPERWHLSFRSQANAYLDAYSEDWLVEAISEAEMEGKATVLTHLPILLERYLYQVSR